MKVIKSIHDYEKFKENLFKKLDDKNKEEKIKKFKKWFCSVYDKQKRIYFDKKLIFSLYDSYLKVLRDGEYWIGCVGQGGTGKTTMMKQILYTLDPTFSNQRVSLDIDSFIDSLDNAKPYTSHLLDEPDDQHHALSKKGRLLKNIVGRVRQENLFIGVNATELTAIPTLFYNKLNSIVYMPQYPVFYYFKNTSLKWQFPVQIIKSRYRDEGYSVFKRVLSFNHIKGNFSGEVPLEKKEEKKYLHKKKKDLINWFKKYKDFKKKKKDINILDNPETREATIKFLSDSGKLKQKEIGEMFKISPRRIRYILKKSGGTREHRNRHPNIDIKEKNLELEQG